MLFSEEKRVVEPKDVTVLEQPYKTDELKINNFIEFISTDEDVIFDDNIYVNKDDADSKNEREISVEKNGQDEGGERVYVDELELPEPCKSEISLSDDVKFLVADNFSDDIDENLHPPSISAPS